MASILRQSFFDQCAKCLRRRRRDWDHSVKIKVLFRFLSCELQFSNSKRNYSTLHICCLADCFRLKTNIKGLKLNRPKLKPVAECGQSGNSAGSGQDARIELRTHRRSWQIAPSMQLQPSEILPEATFEYMPGYMPIFVCIYIYIYI